MTPARIAEIEAYHRDLADRIDGLKRRIERQATTETTRDEFDLANMQAEYTRLTDLLAALAEKTAECEGLINCEWLVHNDQPPDGESFWRLPAGVDAYFRARFARHTRSCDRKVAAAEARATAAEAALADAVAREREACATSMEKIHGFSIWGREAAAAAIRARGDAA